MMTAVPPADIALQLTEVSKVFPARHGEPVHAVDAVNLTVHRGELVALLGPNGAGKSTTIDMALGLTNPSSGRVSVFGHQPRQAVKDGQVSAVLQSGGLLGDLSVRETMVMIASLFPGTTDVDAILERVGIADLAKRRVSKCSGGEQQRLRFALSLIADPDLLILDEPTTGMDVTGRRQFWDRMHAEAAAGRTIIFATHYLPEADEFAQRIVLISDGRIVADGPTSDIRSFADSRRVSFVSDEATRSPVVAQLTNLPTVSEVTVERDRVIVTTSASDDIARVVLNDLGGRDLEISAGSLDDAFVELTQTPASAPN